VNDDQFDEIDRRAPEQEPRRVEAFVVDLNGVCRGKWLLGDGVDRALSGGLRFPLSTVATDIFGEDVAGSGLIFEAGDRDGEALPVHATPQSMPWLDDGTRQV
jgi:glutamine synthetase